MLAAVVVYNVVWVSENHVSLTTKAFPVSFLLLLLTEYLYFEDPPRNKEVERSNLQDLVSTLNRYAPIPAVIHPNIVGIQWTKIFMNFTNAGTVRQ